MKKSKLLLGLLGLSCCVISGCKKKDQSENANLYNSIEDLGEFDSTSPVTISFYHTMGQDLQKVLNNYIGEFNKIYPNITIDHFALGGYSDVRDQLSKELGVGGQANITYCYPDHVASYLKTNKVLNLDIVANDPTIGFTTEQKNDFVESYYNEGKNFGDGHLYCLPFSKSTEVLYYDKTFFDANSEYISVPTTWEEMEDTCKWIKENYSKDCPLGYDSSANLFITLAEQSGAEYTSTDSPYFKFNNSKNKENVKMLRDWHKKGYIETKLTYGQYTSGLFTQTDSTKPRCYMCIGSSAGASYQTPGQGQFEVGITEIPQVDVNNKKVISQGPSVCIFQDEDPQKVLASWLFIKYLTTSIEFQAEFSMTSGYVPVINSVFENETYKEFLEEANGYNSGIQAYSCNVCTNIRKDYFTSPAFDGSASARDVVDDLCYKCMIADDESTIDSLFAEAISKCNYSII